MTLVPTLSAEEDSRFSSQYAPRGNHIKRITFSFSTAGKGVWQKGGTVPKHFDLEDRSLCQRASSGLLESELADLTYDSD